ncbi:uncharacterized protein LOC131052770 isoform X2 [Cryptomeria japonica]|uniref:uncharacterized protein LOC131052770 isoform X2 n=1 Tax=Cryptomeria japonica TaxID=3369 RepID=UPI0027D9D239|nr:uncharacterized protein LOC131052770 isoform X2 [Cryptomeria japonica]
MDDESKDFNNLLDEMEIAEEEVVVKEDEHECSGELHSDIEIEVEEEEPESCEEALKMEISRELDEKLKENLAALTSREFTVRLRGAKGFRDMLQGESGAEVLQLYVKASPGCTELLEAWKLGIQGKSSVSIFLLIAEILKHPGGKDDCSGDHRSKITMYVSLRLDKLASTIVRTKMHDVYEEINSHGQKRQNAVLLLMAAIVRRGRTLSSEVAASFDFENKVIPKLAEWPKGKKKGGEDNKKTTFLTRRGFIEFAMAFLEASTPSVLRHVLRKQSLYGGVLRGLGNDDEETIVYVLGIMREKVLGASSMVPSWVRSAVFGDTALEQLSIISANFSLGKAADVAYEVLLMLCTDSCHGLFPELPQTWGIFTESKKFHGGNSARLLRLMLKLRSSDVDNHRNLLLAIVSNQPSLVSAYLDSFPYSLEPRASSTWFAAISLVSDLIQASKVSPSFSSLATEGFSPPSLEHPMLCDRLKCMLPRSFSRAMINRGLLHANIFVKHGTLRVLKDSLDSLESLLNAIRASAENVTKRGHSNEMQKECLSKFISESHLLEVKGLSGLTVLRALSGFAHSEEKSSHTLIELSRQKWFFLYREVQDEVRGLLPDPQVFLSLLSSTKSRLTGSAAKSNKRNFPSTNSEEVETNSKFKKKKSDSIDNGVEIVVSGINHGDGKDILEGSGAFYPNQDSHAFDSTDEDLISITQIWGIQDVVSHRDDSNDEESVLYTKVLDVLGLYQRTLSISTSECSFDAFKLLPEEPLHLSTSHQQAILSLLVEATGGLNLPSSGFESHRPITGQLYKYLRPLLKLMLYSPAKDVRRYAHLLAYRAMLSTCAFERNKGEIEVWFSFLSVQNSAEVVIKKSQEIQMHECKISDMSGGLASTVVEFLCDAVSTVGKNLFKYLDEQHCLLSTLSSREDLAPPRFSPLVICVLQKCLRVVESSSKSQKLAHRTMISFYVASVMNFLLQVQANSRPLSFTIVTTLLGKVNQLYESDHGSEDFLCEWSPLRSLLLFAQGISSEEKMRFSLESINHFWSKGNPTIQQSLSQVLSLVENTDFEFVFGAATAFASSIVSAMPEEIVENFPSLVTFCHKVFGKDYYVLLALLCAHRDLFGRIAEAWDDYFSLGLKLAGNFFLTNRYNINLQVQQVDKQDFSVNDGFEFYQMIHESTEKQLLSVSMGDACSNDPATVAFASFIKSIPFSALFMLSANSYQSRLLSCMPMKAILEAKLSEVSCDYINMLQLILHWILQIESSWSEGADSKVQLETCFCLLRNLLIHTIEGFWSDHCTDRLDVGLDTISIEEIIHTVLDHPVINMFMHKWMCHSVSKNTQGLENCDTEHVKLHCNQWQRKTDQTSWKIFLGLCQENVHVIDNGILNILMTLMEFVSSQCKINRGQALNQWDSFCKAIVASSKPLILQSFAVFKIEIAKSMKGISYEISPLPSFYVLSVLSPFVSPFSLLELVHWMFSNDIYEHMENATSVPRPNISYLDIGLYFGTVAFEMFHAYLNQAKGDACIQKFFWDLDGQNLDANLVREVYVKIIEVAIKQNSKTSELCLLAAMKALHVEMGAVIPPCILPIGIFLAHLSVFTPTELVKYCIYNTNRVKAEILLLLTQISNLHLTIYGELIGANMTIDCPAIHLIHVKNDLIIDEKYLEENTDFKLSENDLLVLLPVTLRYISSNSRRTGASFLQSSKMITVNYFDILWKVFMKWDKYTCSKEFDILEYDEERYMITEDFICYFQGTLLGQAIQMLKAFPSLEKLRKKRRKLFTCIVSNIRCLLDCFNNDVNAFSFKEMLNVANRVIAKVSLARWLLFPKSACLNVHPERNSEEQPQNGVSKCGPGKMTESDILEWKMETSEYARFINCLIGSLNAIFQLSSIQSQTFGVMESRNRANLLNFVEKTILNNLVDVSKEIGIQSVKIQYLPSLKAFTKLIFLHRFENCMALNTLRCLFLLLSVKGHDSDIVVQFVEDALTFLMAHSQFIPTMLSTSFESSQSHGQSDKGTMFRSLTGILNLLAFSSPGQHGALNSENMTIYPSVPSRGTIKISTSNGEDLYFEEKKKLEIVKLLRMLYLLRVQLGSLSGSGETFMNAKKLVSLLLAGYGATISDCDLEIYSLLHEIECFNLKNFCGLSEMDYLWGEAALKTAEERKSGFRDNLLIDPKVCGETILYFPFNRSAWDGPLDLSEFAERSFKNITLETEERPSLNSSCIVCYDPAFILEFSLHALAVKYIDPMDFSRLGLLGLAFASLSSPNESMRKLAYAVLGRYTQNLENGRNFKGRSEILLLLTHVKNGIVEPWQKIPSVMAIFAAEASCILMDSTNNHYTAIIRFLMGAPTMVLESIPLFHKMFGSGKDHYQNDRIWILHLVAAGLNLTDDFQIYRRKFVLEFLMSFYGSPLADFKTKLFVLQDKLKLLKLALWAISSALQAHSLSSIEEEVYADKQWKSLKVKEYQEALMDKLLRWLVASVICGKILRADNQRHALYPMEKPNFENLVSLLNYLKASSHLSEIEKNAEVDKNLAQLILYLHQLVGVRCRVLPSVVAAVSLLLHSGDINFIDGTSWHTGHSSMLALLLSEVPCPVEVYPSWRWSFYSPWEDLSSKISEKQRLYEKDVCQVLLRSYQNVLSATTPPFHLIISRQQLDSSDAVPSLRNEVCNKLDGLKEEMCKAISNGQSH